MPETLRDKAGTAFFDGNPQDALHLAGRHIDVGVVLLVTQAWTMEEFKAELDWYLKFIGRIREEHPQEHLSQVLTDEIDVTIESLNVVLSQLERHA